MSPFGLGNDIGGSVRNPAFCCGVSSLKPTPGRLPMASSIPPLDPMIAFFAAYVHRRAISRRRVEDLRTGMRVMGGRVVHDPRSVDVPFDGPGNDVPVAALVTSVPGVTLPSSLAGCCPARRPRTRARGVEGHRDVAARYRARDRGVDGCPCIRDREHAADAGARDE